MKIPVETVFSREIVTGTTGSEQGIKSNPSNPVCLARSTAGSQLSIANKAFVEVLRRPNIRRPSDLVKKSDVALFVQNSLPENNAVHEVGFDDRKIYPAYDQWVKTPSLCNTFVKLSVKTCSQWLRRNNTLKLNILIS